MNQGRRVLLTLMGAFFAAMAARLLVSPLVPEAVAAFETTPGALGLALTGMWLSYALVQLPAGVLAARHGARTLVVSGLLVTAVASGLLAAAPSALAFGAAVVALGVGPGLYFPAAAALLAETNENVGSALGLHISGGDAAGVVVPLAVTAVTAAWGWRATPLLGVALALAAAVGCRLALPAPSETAASPASSGRAELRAALGRVFFDPRVRRVVLFAACLAFCFQSITSFLPAYLQAAHGLSPAAANARFSLAFAVWILGMPVAGRLADTVGTDRVLAATVVLLGVGVAVTVLAATPLALLAGVVLVGLGMTWGGVVGAKVMAALGEDGRTSGYGAVRSAYGVLGASGSVAVGALATAAGWRVGWSLLLVLVALALCLLAWDARHASAD